MQSWLQAGSRHLRISGIRCRSLADYLSAIAESSRRYFLLKLRGADFIQVPTQEVILVQHHKLLSDGSLPATPPHTIYIPHVQLLDYHGVLSPQELITLQSGYGTLFITKLKIKMCTVIT